MTCIPTPKANPMANPPASDPMLDTTRTPCSVLALVVNQRSADMQDRLQYSCCRIIDYYRNQAITHTMHATLPVLAQVSGKVQSDTQAPPEAQYDPCLAWQHAC